MLNGNVVINTKWILSTGEDGVILSDLTPDLLKLGQTLSHQEDTSCG